jgi:hypothetical protein
LLVVEVELSLGVVVVQVVIAQALEHQVVELLLSPNFFLQ